MANTKWLWFALLAFMLSACGGDDDNDNNTGSEQPTNATVKVAPVSADAPLFSILVDADLEDDEDGSQLADLTYGQVAAFSVPAVATGFTVRYALPEGAGSGQSYEEALAPFELSLKAGTRYELFIGGSYPDAETWVVETPVEFGEAETQARLTLVNAAPAMPAMDVHLTAAGAPIDSSTLIASLNYQASDNSIRVDEGDYQIRITDVGSSTVVYSSPEFTLSAGSDVSFAAIDNVWVKEGTVGVSPIVMTRSGPSGNSGLLFDTDAGAELRVVQASPDAELLDVIVDNDFTTPFAEDFPPGEIEPYRTLTGGVHNFKVVPAGSATAVIDTNFNLFNGVAWTMLLVEPREFIDALFVSENARPIAAHGRLRLIHASNIAGAVDVYITEPGADLAEEDADGNRVYSPLGTGLGLKNVTSYLPMENGTYAITLTKTVAEGETPPDVPEVVHTANLTVEAGGVYTLLLRDAADMTVTHNWLDGAPAP